MPKYLVPETQEDADQPHWWAPLVAVAKAVEGKEEYRFFDVADFMMMAVVVRGKKTPSVYLYKHIYTRRYLNLDEGGHAYRYIAPPDDAPLSNHGRYKRHEDPERALVHLRLWELPWMKESLDHFRYGRPWNPEWENKWSDLPPIELQPRKDWTEQWEDLGSIDFWDDEPSDA